MARKLFSPIAKGRSMGTLQKAEGTRKEAALKSELMTKIALLNEILSYGYEAAIEDESGENRKFMETYKNCSNKEIMTAIKSLEQKLFQL